MLLLGMVVYSPWYFLLLWIAGMCIPFWVGWMLKRKVVPARRSAVPARIPPWVVGVIVAVIARGVNSSSPAITKDRWFQSALGVALAFAFGYPGVRRKRVDQIWLGIYLLGLSVSLLWWPGGPNARFVMSDIAVGGGFIVFGLARLRNFHFPTENRGGST